MKLLERKQDTRHKIELGGLMIKAGLDRESTNVIYGAAIDAVEKLSLPGGESYRKEWRLKGDIALTMDKKLKRNLVPASQTSNN